MTSPRFDMAAKAAARIIAQLGIGRLPVDPFWIIGQHADWAAMDYGTYGRIGGLDIEDVVKRIGSTDGCAFYDGARYLILYNTHRLFISEPRRIRWTLTHEIGHIVMNHLVDTGECVITRNSLSTEKYEQLETEADFFAASVLAPRIVLNATKMTTQRAIEEVCELSKLAAKNREQAIIRWLQRGGRTSTTDMQILKSFRQYVDQRFCTLCGTSLINKDAKFCPVCGSTIVWGETEVTPDFGGFSVDENGRANACPRCGYDKQGDEGNYCAICGAYLYNQCTNQDYDRFDSDGPCGRPAAGNARYCIHCGAQTTFFRDGLLRPWTDFVSQDNATALKQVAAAASWDDENDLPF